MSNHPPQPLALSRLSVGAGRVSSAKSGKVVATTAFDRNPQTGQFQSGQPIPSPAAMQQAYPTGGAAALRPSMIAHDPRTVAAATGTEPVRSHPKLRVPSGIGTAAKAETSNVGSVVAQFLRRSAKPRL